MATKNIRPNVVFNTIDTDPDRVQSAQFILPNRYTYSGSPTTIEKFLLATLLLRSNPQRVFEFGTFMGATTRIFRDNTQPSTEIYTIDIDNDYGHPSAVSAPDMALVERSKVRSGHFLKGVDNVHRIRADSTKYDYSKLLPFDFIWIDGGHDLHVVKPDTENALKIINRANPNATIAWHDYGNKNYPDLTAYLDSLSNEMPIYWVEETMVCFSCPNKDPQLPHTVATLQDRPS